MNVYVNGNVNGGERGRTGGEGHTFLVKKMRKTGGADGPVRGKGNWLAAGVREGSVFRVKREAGESGARASPSAPPGAPRKTRTRTSRRSDGRAVSPRPPQRRAAIPRFLAKKIRKAGGADGPVRGKGRQPVQPSALRVGEKQACVRPGGGLGETALPVGTPAVPQSCAVRSRERGRPRPQQRFV